VARKLNRHNGTFNRHNGTSNRQNRFAYHATAGTPPDVPQTERYTARTVSNRHNGTFNRHNGTSNRHNGIQHVF
jgi:hypothetical protein